MKKFFSLYLPFLVACGVALLNLPVVKTYLSGLSGPPSAPGSGPVATLSDPVLLISVMLGLMIVVNHYYATFKPLKKYELLNKHKWDFLNYLVNSELREWERQGFVVHMTLMTPKRKWTVALEPKADGGIRRSFFTNVFKIAWHSEQLFPDKGLTFTVNQGLCGKVFKSGKPAYRDLSNADFKAAQEFNLTSAQVEKTGDIKALLCVPVWKYDESAGKVSDEVIGVLNLEFHTDDDKGVLKNQKNLLDLTRQQVILANFCNKIL